jgi:hypothetical protein
MLGIAHWSYDLRLEKGADAEDDEVGCGPRTWAYVIADPKSEYFLLVVYPESIRRRCKEMGWQLQEESESTIIHELLHVMWSPYEDIFTIPDAASHAVDYLREPIVERTARLLYEYLPKP